MNWRSLASAFAFACLLVACGGEDEIVQEKPSCTESDTLCGDSCVDTNSDARHCGGCGITCGAGEICDEGACVLLCPGDQEACGSECVQLETSPTHCGACDNACAAGQACADGACVDSCPGDQEACSGGCFDLDTSQDHCGACGNACATGEICSEGACVPNCADGQAACEGGCYDLQTTREHCGACGTACGDGEVCSEGGCVVSCPGDQVECSGGCFDLDTSNDNCGACGTSCGNGEACVEGQCVTTCADGFTDCDGTCRDLDNDPSACGACGTVCEAGEICAEGSCELFCTSGLEACEDGCRDFQNDPNHCGACGVSCAAGEICVEGSCQLTCLGFAATECEGACTNTDFDPANCGACGNACAAGEVCSAGACVAECAPTGDVCDGGCTDLDTDPLNCGTCGNVCPAGPNQAGVCQAGTCVTSCMPGTADCDFQQANGCEVTLATDPMNCGGCGNVCTGDNSAQTCVAGVCEVLTCTGDYVDCDGDPTNGCEALTDRDARNCGACGNVCDDGLSCVEGACVERVGEDCNNPIDLVRGIQHIPFHATQNDHLIVPPSCGFSYAPQGGDVVLRYEAPADGPLNVRIAKTVGTRWAAILTGGACGVVEPELACSSEAQSADALELSTDAVQGQTYWVYVSDVASGEGPLTNPLEVEVDHRYCDPAADAPVVTLQAPAPGTTEDSLRPTIRLRFLMPIQQDAGTVTITGNKGTNHTLALSSPEVTFAEDGRELAIAGLLFEPDEQVTVTASGIRDGSCGQSVAADIVWSFSTPVVSCKPGSGGMVAGAMTPVTLGIAGFSLSEYYLEADADPNGWVYFGGISALYRARKDASQMAENITETVGLQGANLGYAMHVDGPNVYTIESKSSGTAGQVYRITADGGQTWDIVDMVSFPTSPTDDFRGVDTVGGTMYLVTQEGTFSVDTQVWSVDLSSGQPENAQLLGSFGANELYNCHGAAADGRYVYTACRTGSTTSHPFSLVRFDRQNPTAGVVEVATGLEGAATAWSIHGAYADGNTSGIFDYLYFMADRMEVFYVCDPAGASPHTDLLAKFGTGTGNYGMGYDPVSRTLWVYDDDVQGLVRID